MALLIAGGTAPGLLNDEELLKIVWEDELVMDEESAEKKKEKADKKAKRK